MKGLASRHRHRRRRRSSSNEMLQSATDNAPTNRKADGVAVRHPPTHKEMEPKQVAIREFANPIALA